MNFKQLIDYQKFRYLNFSISWLIVERDPRIAGGKKIQAFLRLTASSYLHGILLCMFTVQM